MGCPVTEETQVLAWGVCGVRSVVQMEESSPQTYLTSKQCRKCVSLSSHTSALSVPLSSHTGVIDAEEIKASLRKIGLCVSDSEVHKLLQK